MAGLWMVAVTALLVAVAALLHARRTARQLAQVMEMYWQLKFDYGELKGRVDPSVPAGHEERRAPSQSFIPLTRLRQGSGEAGSAQGE